MKQSIQTDLKFDNGKPMVNLVEPDFILGIAEVLTYGASKYKEESWKTVKNGKNRYYAAAMRHLLAYKKGELVDKETGLSHLHHAAANLMFLSYYQGKQDELQPASGTVMGDSNA